MGQTHQGNNFKYITLKFEAVCAIGLPTASRLYNVYHLLLYMLCMSLQCQVSPISNYTVSQKNCASIIL